MNQDNDSDRAARCYVEPTSVREETRSLLDSARLAAIIGDDPEMASLVIAEFARLAPEMLSECGKALDRRDGPQLQHWAHTLKGSCATVGAWTLTPLCLTLEELGEKQEFGPATLALEQLRREWEHVEGAVNDQRKAAPIPGDTA